MTTPGTNDVTPPDLGVDPSPVDIHLDMLLTAMHGIEDENDEGSFELTLVTTGGTISGIARSRSAWTKAQIEILEDSGSAGNDYAASVIRIVGEKIKELKDENGESLVQRDFINLQNARLLSGGVSIEYPWLRVGMKHIVAWNLGVPSAGNV